MSQWRQKDSPWWVTETRKMSHHHLVLKSKLSLDLAALWKQICLLAFHTWCHQGALNLFPLLISSHFWLGKYTKYKGGVVYHVFKIRDQEKRVFFFFLVLFKHLNVIPCIQKGSYTINLIYILHKSATNPFYFGVWILLGTCEEHFPRVSVYSVVSKLKQVNIICLWIWEPHQGLIWVFVLCASVMECKIPLTFLR